MLAKGYGNVAVQIIWGRYPKADIAKADTAKTDTAKAERVRRCLR